MTISPKASAWFEQRAIDPETAVRMGTYSARRKSTGDDPCVAEPDPGGDILAFPYMENGKEVATKYSGRPRADGSKVFWQRPGGRKTFYNADVLDDPLLRTSDNPLVITEGEPDCLAVLTAGYPFAVSVPDGAPPARDQHGNTLAPVPHDANDVDQADDVKYAYITNNWHRLKDIKRFVLMTDADEPGLRLRDELARRLGRVRCSFVEYPDLGGKKADANELLIQRGALSVLDTIKSATPFPVRGLYRISEFPETPEAKSYSTGWGRLDLPANNGSCAVMLELGSFLVALGQPASGKSTWLLQLAARVALIHGWRTGITLFEMKPVPHVRHILRMSKIQKPRRLWTAADIQAADEWIEHHFFFIHADPSSDEEQPTLDWLLARARDAVTRYGINMFIIDPWNEIEHQRDRNETGTEYAGRAIRSIKQFARAFDVLTCVAIHPTKSGAEKGSGEMSLYDADGSAHWVNKPDIGLVIQRDYAGNRMIINGKKFRYRHLGTCGSTDFVFDTETELVSD